MLDKEVEKEPMEERLEKLERENRELRERIAYLEGAISALKAHYPVNPASAPQPYLPPLPYSPIFS